MKPITWQRAQFAVAEDLIMVAQCTTVEIDCKRYALIMGSMSRPFLMAAQVSKRKHLLQSPHWPRSLAQRGQLCHDWNPQHLGESFGYETYSVISSGLFVWAHTREEYR